MDLSSGGDKELIFMHVVLVGDYPQEPNRIGGGVEAVVLYLSQALQKYPDLKLSVVTLEQWGRGKHSAQHGDVTVHYVPPSTLPSRLSIRENIRQMRAQIAQLQPDLVHAHGTGEYAFAAAKSAAKNNVPWVLTLHGMRHQEVSLRPGLINRYRAWLVEKDERAIVGQAKHLISINPHVQSVFGDRIRNKVYTIENPIAEAFFHVPNKRKRGQILYVGRLTPRKDIMTLLHAFAQIHEAMPDAKLLLAGEGNIGGEPSPYYLELRRFVVETGLDRAVQFLGNLDDNALLGQYATCSALVLASKVETAPMAITQAMAAGKPVVSTNAGGARYLVQDGETGFIVPVQDSRALASALLRVLDDETTAELMGRSAKQLAEQRFRASVVAEQTRAVYDIATASF
jgi:glycosyltransferase involved in cell wall biosynthesis